MLGVLPKSQGIANKKDDLAKREVIFCLLLVFSLSFVSVFSLFLFFFFMLFPNPAVLFLHHPAQFPVLSLLACQP